jgi:hypothetical protein
VRYDASTNDCVANLRALLSAYENAIAGNTTLEVRFNERWTTYNKVNASALLELYRIRYRQCPHARNEGLPSINPGERAQRRAPTRGYWNFPRL